MSEYGRNELTLLSLRCKWWLASIRIPRREVRLRSNTALTSFSSWKNSGKGNLTRRRFSKSIFSFCLCYPNVLLAFLKPDGQVRHHVFVVVQQFPEKLRVFLLVVNGHDLGKVVEDVKGTDVELVNGQDGGIAADDEGQRAEAGDAVGDPDRELFVQVLCTAHDVGLVGGGVHDRGRGQANG